MPLEEAHWLPLGNGAVWLVWQEHEGHPYVGRWTGDGVADAFRLGSASGWDACVDSDGAAWVAWSEGVPWVVYTRRCVDGTWGPRLQVSTGDADVAPTITPDEYGNVWITWYRHGQKEIWMCRMGARSGQQTLVTAGVGGAGRSVAARQGRLYVAFPDERGNLAAVEGTENEGFGPPAGPTGDVPAA